VVAASDPAPRTHASFLEAASRVASVETTTRAGRVFTDASTRGVRQTPGSGKEELVKTIVVGFDGTEAAGRALERAADLAEAFQARLVVTSVAPVLVPASHGSGAIDPTDTPADHEAQLEDARTRLASRSVETEVRSALGDPAEAIVGVAEEAGADLIVVGTREPNFVQRLLGQSVSSAVARHARCDVLIVH
jgi:nucleotide-binding universal stress UspA family protein